ncbi:hypothetical protein [Thalassococcus lentus]|uniref:Uncharacterized protein n=1 Tax=Thalassococcus lentus TaxID=1210524 RepID=A0ABT4XVK2_9RHOB|nr:hypothetical protein [Thalassococcus lentus]MDA7425995.1 hypothetical protein [Thalassococcus lentus]
MSAAQRNTFQERAARLRLADQQARATSTPIEEPDPRANAKELAMDIAQALGVVLLFMLGHAVLWLFLDGIFPPGFMSSGFAAMASLLLFTLKADSSKAMWGGGLAGIWIAVLAGPYLSGFAPTWAVWLISPGANAPLP